MHFTFDRLEQIERIFQFIKCNCGVWERLETHVSKQKKKKEEMSDADKKTLKMRGFGKRINKTSCNAIPKSRWQNGYEYT